MRKIFLILLIFSASIFLMYASNAAGAQALPIMRLSEIQSAEKIAKAMKTGSMLPTFDDDYLLLKSPTSLSIGDIVVYEKNQNLVVHRIIFSQAIGRKKTYLLKGDNNIFPDGWVNEDKIKYKVAGLLK